MVTLLNPVNALYLDLTSTQSVHNNTTYKLKMVRVKHRYILGNILFPQETASDKTVPDVVSFRKPCPPGFDSHHLRRVLISSILDTFGEYGGGTATPGILGKTQY